MNSETLREGETVELKRVWTDEALRDLAAFANTHGGILYIGIEDDGTVVGAETGNPELRRIASVITDRLGINPSIRVLEMEGRPVIAVQVSRAHAFRRTDVGIGPGAGQ